jgi:hypothetical protein
VANIPPNITGEKCMPIAPSILPKIARAECPYAKKWTPFAMKNIPKNSRINSLPKFSLSKFMDALMS